MSPFVNSKIVLFGASNITIINAHFCYESRLRSERKYISAFFIQNNTVEWCDLSLLPSILTQAAIVNEC